METTTMNLEELRKAARNHDNIQNEGGEGYNPYQSQLDGMAFASTQKRTLTQVEKQLDRAREELSLTESATVGDHTEEIVELKKHIRQLKAERSQLRDV